MKAEELQRAADRKCGVRRPNICTSDGVETFTDTRVRWVGIPAEVWKYGGGKFVKQTAPAPMEHQTMGGRPCTTSLEGYQHSDYLQKRKPNIMW